MTSDLVPLKDFRLRLAAFRAIDHKKPNNQATQGIAARVAFSRGVPSLSGNHVSGKFTHAAIACSSRSICALFLIISS